HVFRHGPRDLNVPGVRRTLSVDLSGSRGDLMADVAASDLEHIPPRPGRRVGMRGILWPSVERHEAAPVDDGLEVEPQIAVHAEVVFAAHYASLQSAKKVRPSRARSTRSPVGS